MVSDNDREYRLPKRVTLTVAAVYLRSFAKSDDMGNFKAAEALLEKYNIGLQVWPIGGAKSAVNFLDFKPYEEPIPNTKEAYKQLRQDVNQWLRDRATGYPFLIPIIFCEFEASGIAITPHSTKLGAASPACLISMSASSPKDKMTVLHEMGHSVLYPVHAHNKTPGNLMHEADGRHFLFKHQVEAFGKAFCARY